MFQGLRGGIAALVVEHRLWKNGLSRSGTWAGAYSMWNPPGQGANTCTLNGQADSQLVDHQEVLGYCFLI